MGWFKCLHLALPTAQHHAQTVCPLKSFVLQLQIYSSNKIMKIEMMNLPENIIEMFGKIN